MCDGRAPSTSSKSRKRTWSAASRLRNSSCGRSAQVETLKARVATELSLGEVSQLKLIHAGKILKDKETIGAAASWASALADPVCCFWDVRTEQSRIKAGDYIIVMVSAVRNCGTFALAMGLSLPLGLSSGQKKPASSTAAAPAKVTS